VTDLRTLADAVLSRQSVPPSERVESTQVSRSEAAKTLSVPLSHPLGAGQRDTLQKTEETLGLQLSHGVSQKNRRGTATNPSFVPPCPTKCPAGTPSSVPPCPVKLSRGTATPSGCLPPSWADIEHIPDPGAVCSCCRGSSWWRERDEPKGWRCCTCHPPIPSMPVIELSTSQESHP